MSHLWSQDTQVGRIPSLLSRLLRTRGAGFGLFVLITVLLVAVAADILSPYNPNSLMPDGILQPPSPAHLFGTDHLGRDVLSRTIHGTRVAVQAGFISVGIAVALGVVIGLIAGYRGGWVDDILMRLIDTLWSFPTLVLALAIAASMGPGLANAMIAIGIVFTPAFARLVRGQTLSVREQDFVTAARAIGSNPLRITLVHIWPNVTAPIIVQSSLMVAQAIIVEAALSFLGLGVEPPNASWGSMVRAAYAVLDQAPWPCFFPGIAIFVTVLGLNLLGDGLRVALDPRLRQRGVG